MVKKSSIFTRIADRWRSGSGVKVDSSRRLDGRVDPAHATVNRIAGERIDGRGPELPSTAFSSDAKTTRKLTDREDAMVALGGHFNELSALMRGVHSRMDNQLGQLVDAAASLQQLPALSNQQLEVLRGLASHMERQSRLGEQMATTLSGLPDLLSGVQSALARAVQSDERTAATMREFQSTMDRIHTSMGKMVEHSEQQAKASQQLAVQREDSLRSLTSGLEQAQRDSVAELRTAADQSLQSLRRTHEDQSNRLQKVVQEHAGWNKAVLSVLGVIALGILALLVMQLVR